MNSDRTNNKEFGMRRHFNPFAGGRFGGNVVFWVGKDRYKIERYFDEKSEAKDSLVVYKNDERCDDFGSNVGEKIFGIDRPSFERTIFINANEIEISSTGSINAKLNNFIEGSTDDTNTEIALERLYGVAKEYKKAKSGNDLISKENDYLLELEKKIDNVEIIKGSLPNKYERLSELEEKLKNSQQEREKRQKIALEMKDWTQYDNISFEAEQARLGIEELKRKYQNGIPSSTELSAIKQQISVKAALEQQTTKALSREDMEMFSKLQKKYEHRMPSEDAIAEIRNEIISFANAKASINSEENVKSTEYEKTLRKNFENHIPTEEELVQIDSAVEEYERAEKAYMETPDYIVEHVDCSTGGNKNSAKKYLIMAIISILATIAGIGVVFAQVIPGVILIIVGGISLLATGFVYLNKKASASVSDVIQRINPEKITKERVKNNAEFAVQRLLNQYGYYSDKNIQFAVEKLKDDLVKYNDLVRTDTEKVNVLAGKKVDCERIASEIDNYFLSYGFTDGDFDTRLSDLQNELSHYIMLKNTLDKFNEQNKEVEAKVTEQKRAIDDFCVKYSFGEQITGRICEIEEDVAKYEQLERDYNDKVGKAKYLKEENKLNVRPTVIDDDEWEKTEETIKEIDNEISVLNIEISENETDVEKLDDLCTEKQQHIELLEKYRGDYDLLIRTAELLKDADRRLKDRYIAPIKNNFVFYAGLLETALGEKVTMTPNFEIRYERNGIERSEKHLSAGQRSICAFCFRMALVDNVYGRKAVSYFG